MADPKLVEALAEFAARVAGWETLADVNDMDRRLLDRWVNEFLDRHPLIAQREPPMSDTNLKLVEALAELIWTVAPTDTEAMADFLARYRLVQLPEEPSEWEVQWGSDEWIGFQTMEDAVNFANEHRPSTTGRIRAVYHVVKYSDLQEVEP